MRAVLTTHRLINNQLSLSSQAMFAKVFKVKNTKVQYRLATCIPYRYTITHRQYTRKMNMACLLCEFAVCLL